MEGNKSRRNAKGGGEGEQTIRRWQVKIILTERLLNKEKTGYFIKSKDTRMDRKEINEGIRESFGANEEGKKILKEKVRKRGKKGGKKAKSRIKGNSSQDKNTI